MPERPVFASDHPASGNREFEMKWRVMLELTGPDGTVSVHEVGGRAAVTEYAPQMVGLTLAEGKRVLGALQVHLVRAQTADHCRRRRRCQQEAVASAGSKPAAAAKTIALSIDGGHVRAARQYQGRSFEVLLAQVSNDEGKPVVFSSVPAEANAQTRQLRGVLHALGATPATPVTILSDGADGLQSLGEAGSPGPTHHGLDWFHLSMRVQHVAQAATC
jgi:hypothetical protein